tara:strand:+ start:1183 stop:1461 length:279 start_codon:yes stop_codon:yes gene_type:complete
MLVVFSKNGCKHCASAKKMLDEAKIDYEERNIDEFPVYRDFLIEAGHKSLPQIYINVNEELHLFVSNGAKGLTELEEPIKNVIERIVEDVNR